MTLGVPVRLIATCPEETKPALLQELQALGSRDRVPEFRAVAFEAGDALFYELHLKLRTASRILRIIKEVPAQSPPMLYSQVREGIRSVFNREPGRASTGCSR